MIHRELTQREMEILRMIRPTTFQDIVDIVRRDVDSSRYNAKKELKVLRNGIMDGTINDGREDVENDIGS